MEVNALLTSKLSPANQDSSAKPNFKTFSLLRQQDNLISQFENNLQKTLDLLSKHQNEKSTVLSTKEESTHQLSPSTLEFEAKADFRHSYSKEDRFGEPISMRESLIPIEEPNLQPQIGFQPEDLSRVSNRSTTFKLNSLESEIRTLRLQLSDLEKENGILKKNLNALSLAKSSTAETEQRHSILASEQREIEELKFKLTDIYTENENLRQEILKVKTESFRKFETLQTNNDELLESYEQRFKLSLKNITERYENEIRDLQREIADLNANQRKFEEKNKVTKERMSSTIMDLEKEKQQLLSQMNNSLLLNESHISSIQSPANKLLGGQFGDTSNTALIDQLSKDKNDIEKKYNDLFTAYNSLLLHNKSLCAKIEKSSHRAELPPPYKGSDSFRSKRTLRDSSLQLKSPASEQRKHTTSPANRNIEASLDSPALAKSQLNSITKVGKIRKNKDLKLNGSINLSLDESGRKEVSDHSPASNNTSALKPKILNQTHVESVKNERKTNSKDSKHKKSTKESKRDSNRPGSAKVNALATSSREKQTVSPRFQTLYDKDTPTASKGKQSSHHIRKPSIESKKKIETHKPARKNERSLSAHRNDKENISTENMDILAASVNSALKAGKKSTSNTPSSKKIPIYSNVKKAMIG